MASALMAAHSTRVAPRRATPFAHGHDLRTACSGLMRPGGRVDRQHALQSGRRQASLPCMSASLGTRLPSTAPAVADQTSVRERVWRLSIGGASVAPAEGRYTETLNPATE